MKKTFKEYLKADKANALFLGLWILFMVFGVLAWITEPVYGFYLWLFWFLLGGVFTYGRYRQYVKRYGNE